MKLSKIQILAITITRIVLGWHFMFEGFVKVLSPNWSAKGYLLDSKGFLSGFFFWIANNDGLLMISDVLVSWGLLVIGLFLIIGLFTKWAAYAAMILLVFFYLSHPPFPGLEYAMSGEGSYYIINKNLIEFFAIWLIVLFPVYNYSFDKFLIKAKEEVSDEA